MAKEEKKPEPKTPKEGSELFHNIMKASVKGNPKPREILKGKFIGEWVYSKTPETAGDYLVWGSFIMEGDEVQIYTVAVYHQDKWHLASKKKLDIICWMKLPESPSSQV